MKITDHVCITWRPFWFWITLIILCAVLFLFASKMLAGSTIFLMANDVCGAGGGGRGGRVKVPVCVHPVQLNVHGPGNPLH